MVTKNNSEKVMKYRIVAMMWTPALKACFGDEKTVMIVELSDTQVIEMIIKFGRAEIEEESSELRTLYFMNDYK